MAVSALELRPRGAVAILDAALRLCARSAGLWALTLPAGALVTAALMGLAEAATHQRELTLPALWLALAWCARGLLQGAACHHVQELVLGEGEPSVLASLRAALARAPSLIASTGYLLAFNTLTLGATLGLSLFFTGAHAVGYAATLQGRGSPLNLYSLCSRLLGPARDQATGLRLLMAVQLLAFFNLHVAANTLLYLGRKLLAVQLTFAERFASLDNPSWLLFLAALTFSLFEPLRAAAATLLLVEGRVRQEGLDLMAQVQQLPVRASPARPSQRSAALVLLALAATLATAPAQAQQPHSGASAEGSYEDSPLLERLRSLGQACEQGEDTTWEWEETVVALPAAESLKLQRLLRRVEHQVYQEGECEALGQLEQGLELARQGAALERSDGQEAAARARDILARPEFAVAPPPPPKPQGDSAQVPSAWERFWRWIAEWLEELFKREEQSKPRPQSLSPLSGTQAAHTLVVVLVAAVVVVLAVVLVRALRRPEQGEAGAALEVLSQPEAAAGAGGLDALSKPPEGWAHLADELAARGEYREAVRHLYLALLSRLHREGAILYDVTLSNWDYLRQYRGRTEWRAPLRELTRRFDFAWYGQVAVGAEGYQAFRSLCAPMLSTPKAGGPSGA